MTLLPFRPLAVFSLLFVLSGCVELSEEYWISESGTGRYKTIISFLSTPKQSQQIRDICKSTDDELQNNPFVESFSFEDYVKNGLHHFVIDITVSDYRYLDLVHDRVLQARLEFNGPADDRREQFDLSLQSDLNYDFVKILPIGLKPSENAEETPEGMAGLVRDELAKHNYSVVLHAPTIHSGNGLLDSKSQTMTWQVSMAEVFGSTMDTRSFKATVSAPLGGQIIWFVAILATLLLLIVIVRKRARRT